MNLLQLNRRVHLYLGLALAPWFLMYGVSGIVFNHGPFFDARDKAQGLRDWQPVFERQYAIAIPPEGDLRPVAARIVKDAGMDGVFGASRQGSNQINVYLYTFWRSTQFKYYISEQRLVAERMRFRWDHFLTGMHSVGGFEQGGLYDVWGAVVDCVVAGMLLWILTGMVMWWKLPVTRRWGWAALGSGLVLFAWMVRG